MISRRILLSAVIAALSILPIYAQLSDAEGNTYQTFKIGNQEWMTENLKITKFQDGEGMDEVPTEAGWEEQSLGAAYCTTVLPSGTKHYFYKQSVVLNESGLAPKGWRMPTMDDWEKLISQCTDSNGLTEIGKKFLNNTALVGSRGNHGRFEDAGKSISWWIDDKSPIFVPGLTTLYDGSQFMVGIISAKDQGHSIRLVRDL